jgi:hypothetical protein
MKTSSRKDRSRSTRARRFAYAAVFGMLLPVVALAHPWEQVKMVSQQDVKALAGTWASSALAEGYPTFERTILVIHKDGTYQLSGFVHSKGIVEIAPNGQYIKAGPFDLWLYHTGESGKNVVLEGDGKGTEVAFGRVHTSTAPSMAIG